MLEDQRITTWPPLTQILFSANVCGGGVKNTTLTTDGSWNRDYGVREAETKVQKAEKQRIERVRRSYCYDWGSEIGKRKIKAESVSPGLPESDPSFRHSW